MNGSRRRWLGRALPALCGLPLAACSSEPLTRFQSRPFDTPSELALWGLDEAAAAALAARAWAVLDALDGQWRRAPAAAFSRLGSVLQGTGPVDNRLLPCAGTPEADLAWRGLALDAVAGELRGPDLGGALLTLGQHLLALGERGFRPWHVGIPDPGSGRSLLSLDLYAEERLVTVAPYARYRGGRSGDAEHPATLAPPTAGAGQCASCSVIVRGGLAARASATASALFKSAAEDWRGLARSLDAAAVLWVGRDGRVEATTPVAKRLLMADQRRSFTERP